MMTDASDRTLALIGSIYDAALEPRRWDGVLGAVCDELHASGCLLGYYEPSAAHANTYVGARMDPDLLRLFHEQYADNPWARAAVEHLEPGRVAIVERHLPIRDVRATAFFADILAPQKIDTCVATNFSRDGRGVGGVSLMSRLERIGDADELEARAELILGHVRRSLEITTRLNVLLLRNQTAEDALDRMRRGVLALDEAGRITFANAAARDIAAANDGLSIVQRRLRAADPAVQGRLAVLVGTVVGSRGRALDAAPPPLNVTRPSGRKPYLVLAVPFRGETPWSSAGHPAALCFVTDPEREIDISVARLAALYGFTPTEAEIVLALAKGSSLRAAATARGIGLSTARTHLQRVFDKVGVRSQMALVQVVTQAIRDLPIER